MTGKRQYRELAYRVLALAFFLLSPLYAGKSPETPSKVMCTTSLLESITRAIGDTAVDVQTIVPYGMCPGHFDLTPGEAERLRGADIVLYHGFERFIDKIPPSGKREIFKIHTDDNCMIPRYHRKAAAAVRDILVQQVPAKQSGFIKNTDDYLQAIKIAEETIRKRMSPFRNTPVVCAAMNSSLVDWYGLKVAAEYGRDEDISVKALHGIIKNARTEKTAMVIGNRQSSGKTGQTIADELGVPFVVLSNFPDTGDSQPGKYPYIETLKQNGDIILGAFAPAPRHGKK